MNPRHFLLSRILAVLGTVLVWLPILAPVLFTAALAARAGIFRLDYLMPAELFPLAFVGGLLLIWASLRAHSRRGIIVGGLSVAVCLLIGGQVLAVVTGLASGEIEPAGWPWVLVSASIAGYSLAVVAMGVGGVLLVRDLFKNPRTSRTSL